MNAITWTTRIAVITAALVILSAGILGYTALYDLFVSIGLFAAWLGIFFPLLFDLAEVTAAVSVFNAKLQGEDDKFAWGMVILFTILGIVANIGHATAAWWIGRIDTVQVILAIFATSLFPLSVALVTHLVKRVITRDILRRGNLITLNELDEKLNAKREELNALTDDVKNQRVKLDELRLNIEALKNEQKALNFQGILPTTDELNDARQAKRKERLSEFYTLALDNPNATLTELAEKLNVTRQTAAGYAKELNLHQNGNGWEVLS